MQKIILNFNIIFIYIYIIYIENIFLIKKEIWLILSYFYHKFLKHCNFKKFYYNLYFESKIY
jgi:hypothetical protein